MLLIYSNVSNFVQNLMNFFSWPKFDEGCWNYHMIPVHSRAVFISPSGAKKNALAIILPLIWLLFCLSLQIDTTSLHVNVAVYFAQIFNFFARIMVNFSALGMRPHPLHPHAVRLCMPHILHVCLQRRKQL